MRGSSKPRAGWVLQCESLLQPENNLAGSHKVPAVASSSSQLRATNPTSLLCLEFESIPVVDFKWH